MGPVIRVRGWCLRQLRRSPRPWLLLDELTMSLTTEQALQRAIQTIGQSDPLIKLLQQIKLGRMKPTDSGLQVVTESWLGTYQQVIKTAGLTKQALKRIDPSPRVAVLIESGVLTSDHPAVAKLQTTFDETMAHAAVE